MKLTINKRSKFSKPYYEFNSRSGLCLNKIMYIKGAKRLKEGSSIYLIELLDHNRIWVTKQELQSTLRDINNPL